MCSESALFQSYRHKDTKLQSIDFDIFAWSGLYRDKSTHTDKTFEINSLNKMAYDEYNLAWKRVTFYNNLHHGNFKI